jgi:hypothetical protein
MPNWCTNTLIVKGDATELKMFIEDTIVNDEFTLNRLYPTPPELLEQSSPNVYRGDDEQEKAKHEDNVKSLTDRYGYNNWYDWRIYNWGTKWDASDSHVVSMEDDLLHVDFLSAWAPPYLWLRKIAPRFPKLRFSLTYYEEGMGFGGRSTWDYDHGFSDEELDLCYHDEDGKDVAYDSDKGMYYYIESGEFIDDEDFIPSPYIKD